MSVLTTGRGGAVEEMTEAIEEMWRKCVRKDREKRRRRHAAAWYELCSRLAKCHARIAEEFERRAAALLEEEGPWA